jgi:hypothetical protein
VKRGTPSLVKAHGNIEKWRIGVNKNGFGEVRENVPCNGSFQRCWGRSQKDIYKI